MARALQRFRPRPDEAPYLEGLYRWILIGRLDRRARLLLVRARYRLARTADLHQAYRELGAVSVRMIEPLRPYLLAQLKGPRCADSTAESETPAVFNAALKRLNADADVKPIEADAVRPSRVLGLARIDLYWQTPEARRLHDDALRSAGNGQDAGVRTKCGAQRRGGIRRTRLLVDVEQWTGRREAQERDYFYQKSMLFGGLLDLMQPSPGRARALRSFVEFSPPCGRRPRVPRALVCLRSIACSRWRAATPAARSSARSRIRAITSCRSTRVSSARFHAADNPSQGARVC